MADLLQLFPKLSAPIEDALRLSIQRFGVLVPVVKDQHGRILDGHHRARLADELAISYRVDVVTVQDEDEARELARTLNADRRQLTEDQRREVVVVLRQAGHSLRAIGGALGVDASTVLRDVEKSGVARATPEEHTSTLGLDGKSYPARRCPASEPVWTPFEHQRRQWIDTHGGTTLANLRTDAALIAWAEATGRLTRIDRLSKWGNPFEVDKDGSRAYVIESFAEHYLPRKPSLLSALPDLKGRVLACWCLPDACHGLVLLECCDRLSYEWLLEQIPELGGTHAD